MIESLNIMNFRNTSTRNISLSLGLAIFLALACDKKESNPEPERVAPPVVITTEDKGEILRTFAVQSKGAALFVIDAPLEKIQGNANLFRGNLEVDLKDLNHSKGQIDVDLNSLSTSTFDDAKKNASQTEHAHHWFELGDEVPEKERLENRWVRFTIHSLKTSPESLASTASQGGNKEIEVIAEGELWLHGVTAKKQVKVALSFSGSPDAPQELMIETLEPLRISLKEHDVKPRDIAGKFLQGALDKVGEKIVDEVQIDLKFKASILKK